MDKEGENNVTDNKFNEFNMGVKKAYRPEWLDSENGLFVNKLNYCAKHFETTHKLVSKPHFYLMNYYSQINLKRQ